MSNDQNQLKTDTPQDFETAIAELEQLSARMSAGNLSLEESITLYKRGVELSSICQKTLADAEQQVQVLENQVLQSLESIETRD